MDYAEQMSKSSARRKYQKRRPPAVTTIAYMTLANPAIASAKTLLDVSDTDGACNRAYYAMFYAANAALLASGDMPAPKSHLALLRLFSLRLIKTGALPSDLGRSLHNVRNLRHVADYQLSKVEPGGAEDAIADAQHFIAAVRDYLTKQEQANSPTSPGGNPA